MRRYGHERKRDYLLILVIRCSSKDDQKKTYTRYSQSSEKFDLDSVNSHYCLKIMFNFGSTGGYTGFGGAPQPQQQQQQQQGFGQFGFAQQQQAQAVMGQAKDVPVPLPPGTDSITCLQWSPNSQFLAASSWDNKVRRSPYSSIY